MNVTLLNPTVEAYNEPDLQKKIERCFRMCYKSEDHIKEGSEAFLTGLIHNDHPNKHWSPLEHARITMALPEHITDAIFCYMDSANTAFFTVRPTSKYLTDNDPNIGVVSEVSGNFRAWMDFLVADTSLMPKCEVARYICAKGVIRYVLSNKFPYIFKKEDYNGTYEDEGIIVSEANDYQTFRIVTTRDILQELARHRSLSFSVESTRYCNYGKKGMTFTLPEPYEWSKDVDRICYNESPEDYVRSGFNQDHVTTQDGTGCYTRINDMFESIDAMKDMKDLYIASMAISSALYNKALSLGIKPQEARMLLPGSLKSELMITGTFKAWKHFVSLRDDQAAHPQIRILAKMIRESLDANHPGWDKNKR